ncbi:STAS domain-containing protein [Streptomyces sp. NPDC047070]|uniref:STAS domain-containing protein n=1 Tax=Streptomyces sp. NPDC047070 TaxID=3154923 RepID=UPI00345360EE
MLVPAFGVRRSGEVGVWAVLRLSGEVDLQVVPRVRAAVDELIAAGRLHMVWDLHEVTFMDSAGVGVLAYTVRSVESRAGQVRLAGAGAQVCRLLELTGMDTVVAMFPDVTAASQPTVG